MLLSINKNCVPLFKKCIFPFDSNYNLITLFIYPIRKSCKEKENQLDVKDGAKNLGKKAQNDKMWLRTTRKQKIPSTTTF